MSNDTKISERGRLIISLDTELAWGWISSPMVKKFFPLLANTREVIDRLLELFDKYEVPVTWAIVGRLLEKEADPSPYFQQELFSYYGNIYTNATYENKELNNPDASFIRYKGLIEQIKEAKVNHELATHTYNHIFMHQVKDKELVKADLSAAKALARLHNYELESIVFPQNQVGHLDVMKEQGIKIYRGVDKFWYRHYPKFLQKVIRQFDTLLPISPTVVEANLEENGMVKIPGSMLFRASHLGWKKWIPVKTYERKALKGLEEATRQKKILHLWFHPFNFGYKMQAHLHSFEQVLKKATVLRDQGKLEILTLKEEGIKLLAKDRRNT